MLVAHKKITPVDAVEQLGLFDGFEPGTLV